MDCIINNFLLAPVESSQEKCQKHILYNIQIYFIFLKYPINGGIERSFYKVFQRVDDYLLQKFTNMLKHQNFITILGTVDQSSLAH